MAWDDGAVKAVFVAAGVIVAWQFHQVFLLLFAAVILGVGLSSMITAVQQRTDLPRPVSAAVAYIGLVLGVVAVAMLLIPGVKTDYTQFVQTLPQVQESVEAAAATFDITLPTGVFNLGNYHIFTVETATNTLSSGVSITVEVLFVFILAAYLAGNPQPYTRLVERFIAEETVTEMQTTLKLWLAGRFTSMIIVGAVTGVGLELLGVPFAMFLGVVAGLFSFIPNLGPILSFLPAGLVALSISGELFLFTAVLYGAVQLVESYVILPQIEKYTVDLDPGLSLSAQLVFGTMFGFIGLLLAVPGFALLRTYLEH